MLTDISGEITDTYTYDAFGILIERTGTTENHYLYTGQQYDANIGFYYLRARYMDPTIGRFVNMDGYWGSSYDPASLHKYLYANANPLTYHDPSGYISIAQLAVGVAISSTLSGIVSGVFAYLRTGSLKQAMWAGVKSAVLTAAISVVCIYFPAAVPYLFKFGIAMIAYGIATGQYDGMHVAEIATHIAVQVIFWSLFKKYVAGPGATSGSGSGGGTGETTQDMLKKNKIPSTLTDDEIATANKVDLQMMAKKDLKMVSDAAKEIGVDRNAFGEYIHELKADLGMKANQNFTYKELLEYAKQLKGK